MTAPPMDRAAAVRGALRTLLARSGFHGASVSAVAGEAGVATGTAYTHYASKDDLVLAAYRESTANDAAIAGGDPLAAQAKPDIAVRPLPLPPEVIYELGLSPAVRLAAGGTDLTDEQLDEIAGSCWRAISQPA